MYPPEQHVLRDLALTLERTPGSPDRAVLELDSRASATTAGRVRLGVLATPAVDVVGAGLALRRRIAPDWLATADLSVHAREVASRWGRSSRSRARAALGQDDDRDRGRAP
jgi:hypothetical protein